MEQFITWSCSEPRLALNRVVVLRFRLHLESLGLAAGTINQRLAAGRRLAYEDGGSGWFGPELGGGIKGTTDLDVCSPERSIYAKACAQPLRISKSVNTSRRKESSRAFCP